MKSSHILDISDSQFNYLLSFIQDMTPARLVMTINLWLEFFFEKKL